MKILHALTGSVASTLLARFKTAYEEAGHDVKYIATDAALNFVTPSQRSFVLTDREEWNTYHENKRVLHIDLTKWADVMVIAPCSANTLAKLANGICDNLVTSCFRARSVKLPRKTIICPAMNTEMHNHPAYQKHVRQLKEWNCNIMSPIHKKLFCGDVGVGAMQSVDSVMLHISQPSTFLCGKCFDFMVKVDDIDGPEWTTPNICTRCDPSPTHGT